MRPFFLPARPLASALALMLAAALCGLAPAAWSAGSPSSAETPADPDFKAGVAAVKRQAWPEVLSRMNAVVQRDARNADAWNYLGYAYRHLGDMDKSFSHYDKALQIDPDHRGAHEYLGEAYLQVGKLAEAEAQVRALDKICWMPCEELRDLKAKVAAWRQAHPQ